MKAMVLLLKAVPLSQSGIFSTASFLFLVYLFSLSTVFCDKVAVNCHRVFNLLSPS